MVGFANDIEPLLFQSRTGSTGHLAYEKIPRHSLASIKFQSRTGSTGHLAIRHFARSRCFFFMLQPPTGSTVLLPNSFFLAQTAAISFSIPNGLHRPFSQRKLDMTIQKGEKFQSRTGSTG